MDTLVETLKLDIVEVLRLETLKPEDINPSAPLFVEGAGLDSIDALELIAMLGNKYGLKIETAEEGKKILYSVDSLAEFIRGKKKSE